MSIMPQEPDSKSNHPPVVDLRSLLQEASDVVARLVDQYPIESAAVRAGIWGDFDQYARQRADELTTRYPCPTCTDEHTYDEYYDQHCNDEGGY